jgi:hypothetical protein
LLLDFLRLSAKVRATSTVAFSLSMVRFISAWAPIDFLARRVEGTVASFEGAIFYDFLDLVAPPL